MDKTRGEIFSDAGLAEVPRILSLIDRKPISKTAGCGDRVFWQWKFVDYPGARFQEAAWTLALAYAKPFPNNPYLGQKRILEWAERVLLFWVSVQHADGSFDEAYPFEKSFVATGFSSLAISEAVLLLGDALPDATRRKVVEALRRAGDFMVRTDETHAFISNHRSGAAAALLRIARITGKPKYTARAQELINSVIARQSDEGWYLEYTGPDPGYQTQGTFYLALCYRENRDPLLLESLRAACAFHEKCFYPDGTVGVEIGSRNTEFIFPGGFEILAREIPEAETIANRIALAVRDRRCPGPWTMDSYNILPITNSFLVGGESSAAFAPKAPLPIRKHFEKAGLFIIRNETFHAIVNVKKGGAIRVAHGREVTEEPGFTALMSDGRIVTSQNAGSSSVRDDRIEVEAPFRAAVTTTMNPWLFLAFRIFSLTLGRIAPIARFIKARLVNKLTRPGDKAAMTLKRTITFSNDQIIVDDVVTNREPAVTRIVRGGPICSIHMGSSQYFEPRSLSDTVEDFEPAASIHLTRVISLK